MLKAIKLSVIMRSVVASSQSLSKWSNLSCSLRYPLDIWLVCLGLLWKNGLDYFAEATVTKKQNVLRHCFPDQNMFERVALLDYKSWQGHLLRLRKPLLAAAQREWAGRRRRQLRRCDAGRKTASASVSHRRSNLRSQERQWLPGVNVKKTFFFRQWCCVAHNYAG